MLECDSERRGEMTKIVEMLASGLADKLLESLTGWNVVATLRAVHSHQPGTYYVKLPSTY